jgi:hypothetical protein
MYLFRAHFIFGNLKTCCYFFFIREKKKFDDDDVRSFFKVSAYLQPTATSHSARNQITLYNNEVTSTLIMPSSGSSRVRTCAATGAFKTESCACVVNDSTR